MGYAFISYSSKNAEIEGKINRFLKQNEVETWVAPDDIPIGSKYAEMINKAIKNCGCFILLLTEEAQSSQWVAKEVERAIHYKRPIVPVMPEELLLNDEFELYLSTDQILPLSDLQEKGLEMQILLATVQSKVSGYPYPKERLYQNLPAFPAPKQNLAQKKPSKLPFYLFGGAALCIAVVVLIAAVSNFSKFSDLFDGDTYPTDSQVQEQTPKDPTPDPQQPNEIPEQETSSESKNQIPADYEGQISALAHSNALALETSTIRIKAGEYATPSAAMTWPNVTLYSQNTDIAVGDGLMVKGISKGETYILVKTAGAMAQPYRVIVE